MTQPARQLIILRHAKAEPFASSDHERVLTDKGHRDAEDAGDWAREAGLRPDYAVVSSAARTRGTWASFSAGAELELEPVFDRSLYGAGTDGALEIINAAPEDAETVLLIGHNPTMAYLVHLLDDGGADAELFARVSAGYPTSAMAVLDVPCAWSDLDVGGARISAFHVGRGRAG
ncbi:SixA phosphatase family protein [Nocardioides marmorisolisilvae]|uniref:SixA phosphatase family protein n=1 Tax=Nocardioides marmorisolisilvae TaxID=1542737 RepID=UPI001614476B|nr:histidine phosphatase family protein [Nocardioides marmorisolisilvae]